MQYTAKAPRSTLCNVPAAVILRIEVRSSGLSLYGSWPNCCRMRRSRSSTALYN